MVVVKVELWPQGDPSRARQIGEVRITNDCTGDERFGNYKVQLRHSDKYWGRPGVWRAGRVIKHLRSLSSYNLVLRALESCLRSV